MISLIIKIIYIYIYSSQQQFYMSFWDIVDYYKISIITITILILAIIYYYKGKKENYDKVKAFMDKFQPLIKQYFTDFDNKIIQESPNILKVYASGRKSSIFVIFGFAMVARQHLLSRLFNGWIFKKKDELVIQIPIKSTNTPIFALAVLRRTYLQNITKKKYPDLKILCKEYKTRLPENLMLIAQNKQLVNLILNDKLLPIWTQNKNLIKIFYMSDINKFSDYPYTIRMVIELKQKYMQGTIDLLQSLFLLSDRLSLYKMSDKAKEEAKTRRSQLINVY